MSDPLDKASLKAIKSASNAELSAFVQNYENNLKTINKAVRTNAKHYRMSGKTKDKAAELIQEYRVNFLVEVTVEMKRRGMIATT